MFYSANSKKILFKHEKIPHPSSLCRIFRKTAGAVFQCVQFLNENTIPMMTTAIPPKMSMGSSPTMSAISRAPPFLRSYAVFNKNATKLFDFSVIFDCMAIIMKLSGGNASFLKAIYSFSVHSFPHRRTVFIE